MIRKTISFTLSVALLVLTAGCATTPSPGGKAAYPSASDRIIELSRALETEKDGPTLAALLFERGHAYLETADQVRDSGRMANDGKTAVEFSTYLLYALADFEVVIGKYPDSAEAPEALFHLGVVYDYPYISSFGIALGYYRRTLNDYPDSEAAARAATAIKRIEDSVRQVMGGEHGEGI